MIERHLTNASEFCVLVNSSNPAPKDRAVLRQYWKASHTDNCACGTEFCANHRGQERYDFIRFEAVVLNTNSETLKREEHNSSLLPLNLFYSETNEDYLLTTNHTWHESDYEFVDLEGYCWPSSYANEPGMASLDLWWSATRKDYQTCGTEDCRNDTRGNGYKFVTTLCAIQTVTSLPCTYALPSISRADEAFYTNIYWRGRIWGPMVQLVYWGLQQYDHLELIRTARRQLCKQSLELLMKEWILKHHVHENFNSVTGDGDDVRDSDPFYHWGALLGHVSLIEAGY